MEGYNNASVIWRVITGLNASYEYYGAQSEAIDELKLGFGNYFLVDDLTLNVLATQVPEPTNLALLDLDLVGLDFVRGSFISLKQKTSPMNLAALE